ncbi:MAG: redoxin domain-containing protein [Simplicispira suum]|nr:redoxin domain-containing protein [Simplicispira suum]
MVVAVFVAVQSWQTRKVPGGAAPDFPLTVVRADGSITTTTLAEWRAAHPGEPVALHFWAEWCPICRTEEGSITSVSQDWPVMTVAMQSGDAAKVSQVLHKRALPWPAALDPRSQITSAHGFGAVPAFVVVDAAGQLRTPTVGYTTEAGMRLRLWWAQLTGGFAG